MRHFFVFFCSLVLFGCQKEGTAEKLVPPAKLSLAVSEVMPGDVVEVKLDKKAPTPEVNILVGMAPARAFAKGDSAYVFVVPVVAPGSVSLSLPSLVGSNSLSLTIKNYTPITNPQAVLAEYLEKRNRAIDSLTKTQAVAAFQPSAETVELLKQLKEELDV